MELIWNSWNSKTTSIFITIKPKPTHCRFPIEKISKLGPVHTPSCTFHPFQLKADLPRWIHQLGRKRPRSFSTVVDVLKEPYKSLESSSNRKDDRPGRGSSFIATYSTHSRLLLLDRTHPEYCTPVAHLRVKSGFSFIFGPAGGFAGKRCKVDGTVGLKFVQNLFDKTYRIYIFNPKTTNASVARVSNLFRKRLSRFCFCYYSSIHLKHTKLDFSRFESWISW